MFGDICKTGFAVETPLRDCGLYPQKSNQRQFISLETANYVEQAPHSIYEAQRTVSTRSHHTLGWFKAFRACADDYLTASRSVKLDFQADEHDNWKVLSDAAPDSPKRRHHFHICVGSAGRRFLINAVSADGLLIWSAGNAAQSPYEGKQHFLQASYERAAHWLANRRLGDEHADDTEPAIAAETRAHKSREEGDFDPDDDQYVPTAWPWLLHQVLSKSG